MIRFLTTQAFRNFPPLCRFYSTGFAGVSQLQQSADWSRFASDAVARCDSLVDEITTTKPSMHTVRLLDDISDTLCQVLDAAEFCRNVHTDPAWRQAAESICVSLGAYVQQLNTNYGLYTALKHALDTATLSADEETVLVGEMLLRDFERYGVHLSGDKRDYMSDLIARAQILGMQIVQNMTNPSTCGTIELAADQAKQAMRSLPVSLRRAFQPMNSNVSGLTAPAEGSFLQSLMRNAESESLRKAAYLAYNQQPVANIQLIDDLVETRHETAQLMGYKSYTHYQLDGFSLANTPEAVGHFLEQLSATIRPLCVNEASQLTAGGNAASKDNTAKIPAWERARLLGQGRAELSSHLATLASYISVDSCIRGYNKLLQDLMQIELREDTTTTTNSNEIWAPGVRKLVAVNLQDGAILGTVYLDLFKRSHKFPGAAHFVLRCGRQLVHNNKDQYQLPIVALVASFSGGTNDPLSHSECETLCHELGHALNSLLSRTKLQHLSGTRGPLDVVEIPSHVMERFAWQPDALKLLCTRHKDQNPPQQLLESVSAYGQQFAALEVEQQIVLSLIDQAVHGESPPVGPRQVESVVAEIVQQHSSFSYVPGTYPHLRFSHLVGYGGTYYSYLYAQCISAELWQRELTGGMLKTQLLEPGGAKRPAHYVEDLFIDKNSSVLVNVGQGRHPVVDGLLKQLRVSSSLF